MSYSSEVLADSPLGYWRMGQASGDAPDSSGNGRTAVVGLTPTAGAPSLLASDTTDTAVSTVSSTGLYAVAAGSTPNPTVVTVEAWIKPNNVSSYQSILDRDDDTTNRLFQFRITNTGKVEFLWWTSTAGPFFATSSTSLVVGSTYHVAATFDGSAARVYINGSLAATTTQSGTLKSGTLGLRICAHSDFASSQTYRGVIDEVAYYGTALSGTRISAHYSAGTSAASTTGTVAATLPSLTASMAGKVTTPGQVAATLPSLTASVSGTVAGITSGTVQATLPSLTAAVAGTVLAPVTGTVQATLPSLTASVTDAAGTSATLPLALGVQVDTVQLLTVVTLTDVTIPLTLAMSATDILPVTPVPGDVAIPLAMSLTARPQDSLATDPRTGADQWRYVVTELDGTPLCELVDIEHDAVEDAVNEPATMQLTMATDDPARAFIKPIERQCQVWQGNRLILRGPILEGKPSDDGTTVTHQIHDPSWWWRGGRRRITRIPQLNLLYNGDFTQGLAGWTGGYDADSIPAAAPNVTIVDEDFSLDDDGINPIKALEINGVQSVTQTKTSLDSAAVFYPNRPFSWEPLAAGFKPGGAAMVDSVASAMPSTSGLAVTIVGHTANDGTGSGMALSLRRAQAAAARVAALRPGAVITTKGVGFYDPDPNYPIDSAQQRRVVISYESTVTVTAKSKQWERQTVVVTQPKAARYPLDITAAAMLKVTDSWTVADANMVALKVVARRQDTPTVVWDEGSTNIADTDPVDRWIGQSASVTIPADDRPYLVDVYLYAPAAQARYAMVGLFPEEVLYFWGEDQALHVKGIVEHMQDTTLGHGNLNVGTRTPLTGIRRDRTYPFREMMPVDTALDGYSALNRGMDIDTLFGLDGIFVATFYPRQGQILDYVLAQGGNVAKAIPATTRDVGSNIIAQAQSLGSYRATAYARDDAAFGGLLLERVITAEQETPINELGEVARAELGWARMSTAGYWLDIDPEFIPEVLAQTGKGDTVRMILDSPEAVDTLVRIVKRQIHPNGLRLMVAIEEGF